VEIRKPSVPVCLETPLAHIKTPNKNNTTMKTLTTFATGIVALLATPSQAQNIHFNLTGSGGHGSVGNTIDFSSFGVNLTASAWSYTKGNPDAAFEASKLSQYSIGLGVINKEENGSSPYHQADNFGENDYVLFVSDTLLDFNNVKITPSPGPYDQDVSYWVGNIASNTSLENISYSGLAGLGFGSEQVVSGDSSYSSKDVSINSPLTGGNAILFGPERGLETYSKLIDAFKIQSISATLPTVTVPEPSSTALLGLGALGLLIRRKR